MAAWLGTVVHSACTDPAGSAGGSSTGDSGASEGGASEPGSSGASPTTDGDGPRLDLGSDGPATSGATDAPTGTDEGAIAGGCSAIDVLFVIDSTEQMSSPQVSLADGLADFVDAMTAAVAPDTSFHWMVVDSDAHNRCTKDRCEDPSETIAKLCTLPGGGFACNGHFVECDHALGAGVVRPAGAFATNEECDVVGPKRWLGAEDASPSASLACMAHVGIAGEEHARPMDAMRAALDPRQLAPSGCNAGFLRPDSLLVVVFVSNDPCSADSDAPQGWYDALAEATGSPQRVVVVGFVPGIDGCTSIGKEPPGCGGADQVVEGAQWTEFVGLWQEHGLVADVCDQSEYPTVLANAAELVGSVCAGIED